MEVGIIYIIPIVVIILVGLSRIIADRLSGEQTENELKETERRVSQAADRIADGTEAVRESETLADRAEETQRGLEDCYRRIEEKAESVIDITKSGRTRAERIANLADECLEILEAAKKTKE